MSLFLQSLKIHYEQDVVFARQRARSLARELGFDVIGQSRMAAAVSEIARNAYVYAGGGVVEFAVEETLRPQLFVITIRDTGPGIANLQDLLKGSDSVKTIPGLGIPGTRRLMDLFNIKSSPNHGTTVVFGKFVPEKAGVFHEEDVHRIRQNLEKESASSPYEEIRKQNQELLTMLDVMSRQKAELERLNCELKDTNRGMCALYSELEEKAQSLKRMNELKARFLANMTHEFKTPLNSILALSKLLLESDTLYREGEHTKQVIFIKKAAEDLSVLVDDLLDLSRLEAGKETLHLSEFMVEDVFAALRGMFKPLATNPEVRLIFEELPEIPKFYSDEAKIEQILRNLISNALKFTEKGEVRVSASWDRESNHVLFSVEDTGIGIAPEDIEKVFEEYGQVDSVLQKKSKGTGLGLPLSKKLTNLLNGTLELQSTIGKGSKFQASIPLSYELMNAEQKSVEQLDMLRNQILVVEDDEAAQQEYAAFLKGSGFQAIPAYSIREAWKLLETIRPAAMILDILLPGENGWSFLIDIKQKPEFKDMLVFVATVLNEKVQALTLGATDFCTKPLEKSWLMKKLQQLASSVMLEKILIIDDDEIARYLLKGALAETKFTILEAAGGQEGLHIARNELPSLVFLDLVMPDLNGFEVLAELRNLDETKNIPVIISTSKILSEEELSFLHASSSAIVPKSVFSKEIFLREIRNALVKISNGKKGQLHA